MLFEAVFCGFWAVALVFIVCEFGQQFTNAFDKFNIALGQLHWYLLPVDIQRMLSIVIINAQQPIFISCFGNITCGRETFKKVKKFMKFIQVIDHVILLMTQSNFQVVNTAYSYFMLLHKIDK